MPYTIEQLNEFKKQLKNVATEFLLQKKQFGGYLDFTEWLSEEMQIEEEKWKPENGEKYYLPVIDQSWLSGSDYWDGTQEDNYRLKNNLVFRTKEEAIKRAKELLSK